nr:uncharacterized protein LOC127322022 [Lolium perenne]
MRQAPPRQPLTRGQSERERERERTEPRGELEVRNPIPPPPRRRRRPASPPTSTSAMASPPSPPTPTHPLSPSPSPEASPRGRSDRWRRGRGSDSEDTPRSYRDALAGERAAARAEVPESSRAREMRSMVCREEESLAFDELDDADDPLEEEDDDAPWEEPSHVTRKRARGRRGGRKVAARAAHTGRVAVAYDDFQGLCLLCTRPGHRAAAW